MTDPAGAIEGVRDTVEIGFGKRLCSYLGQAEEGPPPCARVAPKEVMQGHAR